MPLHRLHHFYCHHHYLHHYHHHHQQQQQQQYARLTGSLFARGRNGLPVRINYVAVMAGMTSSE